MARHVLDAGFPADAVSPAYYAVFHAAEAALAVEGDEPRTHQGVKSLFGLRFARTGRLPAELASIRLSPLSFRPVRIFLDSSVLLAASGSAKGSSRALFHLAAAAGWKLARSPYAVTDYEALLAALARATRSESLSNNPLGRLACGGEPFAALLLLATALL